MSYLLAPNERKSFTIDKDTATYLAAKLARGESLKFQSVANRNWVAKIARTRFGALTSVFTSKDQLLDPRYTVEGRTAPDRGMYNEKHWFNSLYHVKLDVPTQPRYSRPSDYEGNIW